MKLFEAIHNRHCYRGEFLDKPIGRDILSEIIKAATAAPSGCNKQTTEFVVVDDEAILGKIASLSAPTRR